MLKWIGAGLIVMCCGAIGLRMAKNYLWQEQTLRDLAAALQRMRSELSCRRTSLPRLFLDAGQGTSGVLGEVFTLMGQLLEQQCYPDAESCVTNVLSEFQLWDKLAYLLTLLGSSLGNFDLQGQLEQLAAVSVECDRLLQEHSMNRQQRIRSFQTLGFCAGAALAILLI